MASAVAAEARWTGSDVRIAEVARRLQELRASVAAVHYSTVTSVLNLVVWTPSQQAAAEAEAVTDELRDHHPSRAVIVASVDERRGIDARVEVVAQPVRSGQRKLQVEQVVLTIGGAAATHVRSAVVPLLRPDLPTFLWWPLAPEPGLPQFVELTRLADRTVTETGRSRDGAEAVARLAAAIDTAPSPITDLAWAVITPWRQLLASGLRGSPLATFRSAPTRVTVLTGGPEPSLEAYLMAGWLVDVFGLHVTTTFAQGDGDGGIVGVRIDDGAGFELALTRDGPHTAVLASASCAPRSLPVNLPSRRDLLAGELEMRGPDHPFERAVRLATTLA